PGLVEAGILKMSDQDRVEALLLSGNDAGHRLQSTSQLAHAPQLSVGRADASNLVRHPFSGALGEIAAESVEVEAVHWWVGETLVQNPDHGVFPPMSLWELDTELIWSATLPAARPLSSRSWASRTSDSGKVAAIADRTMPFSRKGQSRCSRAATISPFSAAGRARSPLPVIVRLHSSSTDRSIEPTAPPRS